MQGDVFANFSMFIVNMEIQPKIHLVRLEFDWLMKINLQYLLMGVAVQSILNEVRF